jgi:hypothetical protein
MSVDVVNNAHGHSRLASKGPAVVLQPHNRSLCNRGARAMAVKRTSEQKSCAAMVNLRNITSENSDDRHFTLQQCRTAGPLDSNPLVRVVARAPAASPLNLPGSTGQTDRDGLRLPAAARHTIHMTRGIARFIRCQRDEGRRQLGRLARTLHWRIFAELRASLG